jgi:hypothetical protein
MNKKDIERFKKAEKWTASDVSEFLSDNTEPDTPDRLLQALKAEHGKRITTRLAAKMPGGPWRIRRQYGMTHLENAGFWGNQEIRENGVSLLLGHFVDTRPLDATTIEELNTCYFSARRQRNHARMEARNTRETLQTAADAINGVIKARAELRRAGDELAKLTAHGEALDADKYALKRAMGDDLGK